MDILKRNVFWLVLAAVLLLAGGFYLLKVAPLRGEVKNLQVKFETHEKNLAGLVDKKGKVVGVPSEMQIKAAKKYRKDLQAEEASVKGKLLERQFDLSKADFDPSPPPATDPVAFREWVEARYRERDEAARKNGLLLPKEDSNPFYRGDYNTTVIFASNDEEQQIVLKRFYITREVLDALSKVEVKVTELVPVKDDLPNSPEKAKSITRGIERLLSFEFVKAESMARTRNVGAGAGMRGPGSMPEAPKLARGRPYKEHLFVVKVTGHFSALPLAVQALDQIDDFVLVVKRVDVSPVAPIEQNKRRGGKGITTAVEKDSSRDNTRSKEAVVSVVLECAVLEYDFSVRESGRKKKKKGSR